MTKQISSEKLRKYLKLLCQDDVEYRGAISGDVLEYTS